MLPEIGTPLLNLINASITSGYVPQSFKIAVIKPILKKPNLDPNDLSNYRPISSLPFLSKILEKAVTNQLCSFLQSNTIHFGGLFSLSLGLTTALKRLFSKCLMIYSPPLTKALSPYLCY